MPTLRAGCSVIRCFVLLDLCSLLVVPQSSARMSAFDARPDIAESEPGACSEEFRNRVSERHSVTQSAVALLDTWAVRTLMQSCYCRKLSCLPSVASRLEIASARGPAGVPCIWEASRWHQEQQHTTTPLRLVTGTRCCSKHNTRSVYNGQHAVVPAGVLSPGLRSRRTPCEAVRCAAQC